MIWFYNDKFVYQPSEDTYFLLEVLKKKFYKNRWFQSKRVICEVGVGNGEIIRNLILKFPLNRYLGTDINSYAIKNLKKEFIGEKNVSFKGCHLLDKIEKNFNIDIIIFNTPYLPLEENEDYERLSVVDKAIYGGKNGYEVIVEFLNIALEKLNNEGYIYFLFSNHSNKKRIDLELMALKEVYNFEDNIIAEKSLFFETLYIYEIKKFN